MGVSELMIKKTRKKIMISIDGKSFYISSGSVKAEVEHIIGNGLSIIRWSSFL